MAENSVAFPADGTRPALPGVAVFRGIAAPVCGPVFGLVVFILLAGLPVPLAEVGQTVRTATGALDFTAVLRGQEVGCLALNIYHEGRGEPPRGRAAIAQVTMNRVRSRRFPDSICAVVWQSKQFSWTRLSHRYQEVRDRRAWRDSRIIAGLFLDGARMAQLGAATHYHAVTVRPSWTRDENCRLITAIGGHLFYTM